MFNRMATSWFGIDQLIDRIEHHPSIGLIGIDLSEWSGGLATKFREEGFEWENWLARSMNRSDLWFGDVVSGHLWLYAGMPASMREDEGDSYLRAMAKRVREAIAAESVGKAGHTPTTSGQKERGIGYASLLGLKSDPIKDVVYDGVVKATERIRESLSGHRDWELRCELERLLAESSIKSVYQPIVRLGDGRVFGYEALTRCPEGSLFDGPLALFRFAEKNQMALALDRLARETAIRHSPALGAVQKIFINVTMSIINDPHFVSGQTVRWLSEKGMFPGQVVFELTERSSIDDFEAAKKILAHYRSQGYEIAIDDAGAGYSSLQSIVELSPDYIKVDRSLVRLADKDEMKKHMLRTFVRFAKKMNIRTVAEGIERPEELRLLRAMGFDFAQGYLIGRPSEFPAAANSGAIPKV
ncbi:EAL domain-containing protein (putative c-di-GMP-specific phosphodiesterase class I) [Cohnella sp. SGD-V74]|uniref:EAL domain-containing protein n=1 Tax=unclassified Cohnella TaxID=2636738 RepID=UPI000D4DA855|nr:MULTISPECIES: EAL domain-containing protein [unclassified Cohnella]PRX75028.1 EAL domain-containing protein (putative c-di-GMP-specific phosphodiesterase class I) [Cohnella sp. SGD-V74]